MKNLFIFMVNYTQPLSKIDEYLKAHRDYLSKQYDLGILLASGPRNPKEGGLIIGKFNSREEAIEFSKNDPFYKNNLAKYEIFEFEPVLHADIIKTFVS